MQGNISPLMFFFANYVLSSTMFIPEATPIPDSRVHKILQQNVFQNIVLSFISLS